MTQVTKTLTHEDMTEILYIRAEEIFLLCATITRRGIAHAFCELMAHTGTLQSRVHPVNTVYVAGIERTTLADIRANLHVSDFLDDQGRQKEFEELMAKMDTYVSYLDLLIEQNQPATAPKQGVAA